MIMSVSYDTSHQYILNLRTDEIVKCRFAKVPVDGATNLGRPKSRTRNDMELVPQHPFSLQKSSRVNVSQKRLDDIHHEHELEAEKSPLRQRERELAAERQKTRTEMARRRASTALSLTSSSDLSLAEAADEMPVMLGGDSGDVLFTPATGSTSVGPKRVDWAAVKAMLPTGRDEKASRKRKDLFLRYDSKGDGRMKYDEAEAALGDVIATSELFSCNPVLQRAFDASKRLKSARVTRAWRAFGADDTVDYREFRLLLLYFKVYIDLHHEFDCLDYGFKHKKLDINEFNAARPLLRQRWKVHLFDDEVEEEFQKIDVSGDGGHAAVAALGGWFFGKTSGKILFDLFCDWVIRRHLIHEDLEDDDEDILEKEVVNGEELEVIGGGEPGLHEYKVRAPPAKLPSSTRLHDNGVLHRARHSLEKERSRGKEAKKAAAMPLPKISTVRERPAAMSGSAASYTDRPKVLHRALTPADGVKREFAFDETGARRF